MLNIFRDINFYTFTKNPDFQEDSVREVIILPISKALGYPEANIIRSKTLPHPFFKISSKKCSINLVPDYVLKVENISPLSRNYGKKRGAKRHLRSNF